MELRTNSPLSSKLRLAWIDELKGFAMLMVLLYHAGGVLALPNKLNGQLGVDIFLLVSGFTLARSSWTGFGGFLGRRLMRIFPAYWLALAAVIAIKWYWLKVPTDVTSAVHHIFAIHGFTRPQYFFDINDSFWFVPLIVALYLTFPVARKMKDIGSILGFALLLTAASTWAYMKFGHSAGISHLPARILPFFLGLIAGRLSTGEPLRFTATPLFAIGSLAFLIVTMPIGFIPYSGFYGVAMASIFLAVAHYLRLIAAGRVVLAGFAWFGVYSYEFFLLHQPFIREFNINFLIRWLKRSPTPAETTAGMVVASLITLAIGFLLHKAVAKLFSRNTGAKAVPSASVH